MLGISLVAILTSYQQQGHKNIHGNEDVFYSFCNMIYGTKTRTAMDGKGF